MMIIGHGFDLVDTARVQRMLDAHGERFLMRCFTEGEQTYARAQKRCVEHLAGRLAVKEAVVKALGTGFTQGIGWTDIETLRGDAGQPSIALHGQAKRVVQALGVTGWLVSISHVKSLAGASVIAVR